MLRFLRRLLAHRPVEAARGAHRRHRGASPQVPHLQGSHRVQRRDPGGDRRRGKEAGGPHHVRDGLCPLQFRHRRRSRLPHDPEPRLAVAPQVPGAVRPVLRHPAIGGAHPGQRAGAGERRPRPAADLRESGPTGPRGRQEREPGGDEEPGRTPRARGLRHHDRRVHRVLRGQPTPGRDPRPAVGPRRRGPGGRRRDRRCDPPGDPGRDPAARDRGGHPRRLRSGCPLRWARSRGSRCGRAPSARTASCRSPGST